MAYQLPRKKLDDFDTRHPGKDKHKEYLNMQYDLRQFLINSRGQKDQKTQRKVAREALRELQREKKVAKVDFDRYKNILDKVIGFSPAMPASASKPDFTHLKESKKQINTTFQHIKDPTANQTLYKSIQQHLHQFLRANQGNKKSRLECKIAAQLLRDLKAEKIINKTNFQNYLDTISNALNITVPVPAPAPAPTPTATPKISPKATVTRPAPKSTSTASQTSTASASSTVTPPPTPTETTTARASSTQPKARAQTARSAPTGKPLPTPAQGKPRAIARSASAPNLKASASTSETPPPVPVRTTSLPPEERRSAAAKAKPSSGGTASATTSTAKSARQGDSVVKPAGQVATKPNATALVSQPKMTAQQKSKPMPEPPRKAK